MEKALSLLVKPASYLCNLNCAYCFYGDVSKIRGTGGSVMTDCTVDALVMQVKNAGAKAVSICFQGGEPTMAGLTFYKTLLVKLHKAMPATRFSYSMQTNGLALDDKWLSFFKEYHFLVGLSLDGTREINDAHRKNNAGGGSFDAIMSAVTLLQAFDVPFNILAVLTPLWVSSAREIYNFFKQNNMRDLQLIPCIPDFSKAETSEYALTNGGYLSIMTQIFDCWYEDYLKADYVSVRHIDSHISALAGIPCGDCSAVGGCGGYFALESDGSVYPCDFYCTNEYLLGNICSNEFSFANITETQKRFMSEGALPSSCKDCRYLSVCKGGCRRDRNIEKQTLRTCDENKKYFDYTLPRMKEIAATVKKNMLS